MNPTIDFSLFGTRQAITHLLSLTKHQRRRAMERAIATALRPQFAMSAAGRGVGLLSDAEQASIQAGLAAADGDLDAATLNRAQDVLRNIVLAADCRGTVSFHVDQNDSMLPTPAFAVYLHEAASNTR